MTPTIKSHLFIIIKEGNSFLRCKKSTFRTPIYTFDYFVELLIIFDENFSCVDSLTLS